jgi:hypothetical protein
VSFPQALLLSAAAAAAILLSEMAGALLANPAYVHLLGIGSEAFRFWSAYAVVFLLCGAVGWIGSGVFWAFGASAGRRAAAPLVAAALLTPTILAPLSFRPELARPLQALPVRAALAALGALLLALLVRAVLDRKSRAAPMLAGAGLWAAVVLPGLAAFTLQQLPTQLLHPPVLLRSVLVALTASMLALPLLWLVLRPRRTRWPLAVLAIGYAGMLAGMVLGAPRIAPVLRMTTPPPGEAADHASVLLIVIDTLRADAVSRLAEGGTTPNLARFARDAVLFENAYSAAPWTTPSFASMLTGTYPSEHLAGYIDPKMGFKHALQPAVTTLPETLGERGYWTSAILTNPSLSRRYGLERGFTAYENLLALRWYHPIGYWLQTRPVSARLRISNRLRLANLIPRHRSYLPAAIQTRRILAAINRARELGAPFFVLGHYMDPHWPYRAPPEFRVLLDVPGEKGEYLAEVRYVDQQLGILLEELRYQGLYDSLLIIVTSDHGEEFDESRGRGSHRHGHTLYDEQLRVPLLVKLPGAASSGSVREETVSLVDLPSTVLGVVGMPLPVSWRGVDLVRVVSDRPVLAEGLLTGLDSKAAIHGPLKVLAPRLPLRVSEVQVFDRESDPEEIHPVALESGEAPSEARALFELLADHAERSELHVTPKGGVVPDPVLRQQLEALGYTE